MSRARAIELRRGSQSVEQLEEAVQIALDQIETAVTANFEFNLRLALESNIGILNLAFGTFDLPIGTVIAVHRNMARYSYPSSYDKFWPMDGTTCYIPGSPFYGMTIPDWDEYHLEGTNTDGDCGTLLASQNKAHDHGWSDTGHTHTDAGHYHSASGLSIASGGAHTHTNNLAVQSDGAHTHGAGTLTTSTAVDHSHSVLITSGAGGSHVHGTSSITVDDHQHYLEMAKFTAEPDTGTDAAVDYVSNTLDFTGGVRSGPIGVSGSTDAEAAHTHLVSGNTGVGGSHSHAVASGATASDGSHTHTLSGGILSSGSSHTHTVTGAVASAAADIQSNTTGITLNSDGGTDARPKSAQVRYYMKVL